MSATTGIEWTDATWNPIVGCSVVSPGCKHCYAMRFAGARLSHVPVYAGLTQRTKAGHVWTGEVREQSSVLDQPLKWRKGRRIFVNSMGDVFHENATDDMIDCVFDVMERATQHVYQVLTKRAKRMREYMARRYFGRWPPPHIWLGVSAEDQERWDERVPELIRAPAAVRFVSAEPLLGPIFEPCFIADLDWLIVGGESGRNARPMHPDWARGLRDQCAAHGVPFFFKQWGEWQPRLEWSPVSFNSRGAPRFEPMVAIMPDGSEVPHDVNPDDVGGHRMARVGKKTAGRLLDGVFHDGFPMSATDLSQCACCGATLPAPQRITGENYCPSCGGPGPDTRVACPHCEGSAQERATARDKRQKDMFG